MADHATTQITSFRGRFRFLPNFWPAEVRYWHIAFPTVEHAYVAAKSFDPDFHMKVAETARPGQVKAMGRKVKIREDWEDVKLSVMKGLVRQKFRTNLGIQLMETAPAELIEGNTWGDTFWGVCNGVGENHLGKILMAERDRLWTGGAE